MDCCITVSSCGKNDDGNATTSSCTTTAASPLGEVQHNHDMGRRNIAKTWSLQLDCKMICVVVPRVSTRERGVETCWADYIPLSTKWLVT